jgi:hypothetical protein
LLITRCPSGAGETREIISFPPDALQFGWRASIATIASDGPFSLFAGVDRVNGGWQTMRHCHLNTAHSGPSSQRR